MVMAFFSLVPDLTLPCPCCSLGPCHHPHWNPRTSPPCPGGSRRPGSCAVTPQFQCLSEHNGFPCATQNLYFFLGDKIEGKCHKSHISFCFSFTACQLPQFTPRGENVLQEKKMYSPFSVIFAEWNLMRDSSQN